MTTTQSSNEELRQVNVRLTKAMHDRLTLEAARRTVSEGKDVTRQDLILEALDGKQEPAKAAPHDSNFYTVTIEGHLRSVFPEPGWASWLPVAPFQAEILDECGHIVLNGDSKKLLMQVGLVQDRLSQLQSRLIEVVGDEVMAEMGVANG